MKGPYLALGLLLVIVTSAVPSAHAAVPAPQGHYVPIAGDSFSYFESVLIVNAFGNLSGYVESDYYNGTISVNTTSPALLESAYYDFTGSWRNNQGGGGTYGQNGLFSFSAQNDSYVQGSDAQAPVPGQTVWFYVNNSVSDGNSVSLLDTPMTVVSTDQGYTGPTISGNVATLFVQGTGTTTDDSALGNFPAQYSWQAFFDPSTGYIVGYQYIEQDNDGSGDGYTLIETLSITHSTYPLTSAAAPGTATVTVSVSSGGCPVLLGPANLTNGQSLTVYPGTTYVATYYPCGASFQSWSFSGGSVASPHSGTTTVTITSSGTLTANFQAAAAPFPWLLVIVVLFVVLLLIVIVAVALSRRRRTSRPRGGPLPQHSTGGQIAYAPAYPPAGAAPAPLTFGQGGQPAVQQVVVRETVKVPCQYCGTLIDSTATACPKCGAPRT